MKAFVASHLKELNRRTVYSVVSSTGETSKAEITRITGISSPTVIKIINHFIEKGLVIECERTSDYVDATPPMGRRPNTIAFNKNAAYSVGIEFEGNYLKIGLVNLAFEMISFEKIHVADGFEQIFSKTLPSAIRSLISVADLGKAPILGIGIGIPSIFDPNSMVIEATPLIGLENRLAARELLDRLKRDMNMPVFMENDVKAAAIGEYWTRGTEVPDLIYISLGTGFAAGIILDGKLRKGPHNIAGEIGYLVSGKSKANSISKTGPMEQMVNIAKVEELLGQPLEHFDKDKKVLRRVQTRIAAEVAVVIANLCISLDVSCVVMGGLLSEYFGPTFIAETSERINELTLMEVRVYPSSRPEPGISGAAHIVMNNSMDILLR